MLAPREDVGLDPERLEGLYARLGPREGEKGTNRPFLGSPVGQVDPRWGRWGQWDQWGK